ncbi:hypothetical protein AB0N61_00395 [Microbacterium sp. NPDC089320]|uniref:hypothetical protein n=1 Tax=Microbacterium sp. NPDC089320 TaxID=3155182 RepID=UPI003423545B
MMDKLEALVAAHGWREVEGVAWGWAATLAEGQTVELALGRDGIDGLGALLLAGPALGGIGADHLAELMAAVQVELGGELLAA